MVVDGTPATPLAPAPVAAGRAFGAAGPATAPAAAAHARGGAGLLRIQEVAAEAGLTPRAIRYYEEMGLLRPAARSGGAYRLYDVSDLERLIFIRDLRDAAGFSLAEIGALLEDEAARVRDRDRFRASGDPAERAAIVRGLLERVDRQVATLEEKAGRLRSMIEAAATRRGHLAAHLAEIEGGPAAHDEGVQPPGAGR